MALRPSPDQAKRLDKLVAICRTFPGVDVAAVGLRQEHRAFQVRKKTFAYYLFDHHGDGRVALCCKAGRAVQQALVEEDPASRFVPPYLGSKGWIAIRLDLKKVDWGLIAELSRKAYQQTAPRTLAACVE